MRSSSWIEVLKPNSFHQLSVTWIQWGSEIRRFEIRKHLKSRLFEDRISNGPVFKWLGFSYSYSPNHLKTRGFKIRTFLSRFQIVCDKMAPICLDFKWLGFHIFRCHSKSRPFATQPLLDHLKSRLGWISDTRILHYSNPVLVLENYRTRTMAPQGEQPGRLGGLWNLKWPIQPKQLCLARQ